jgi:chloramphenicol-sensitive protein RarD
MICFLKASGRMQVFKDTITNKTTMRCLVPAACFITINWGLFIWAVNSGRVLDSSLGYYMNPLIAFLLGILVFKEKYIKLQLVAVGLAFTGVLISLIAFGSFPIIAICLSLSFAVYGILKKKSQADPAAGIAVESMIVTPFALVFSMLFMKDSIFALNLPYTLLLVGGGALTAIPLVLYARAINDIPFIIVGFFQYISPSIALAYGLITGETPSGAQIVSFIFIGLGLIVFSIALLRKTKDAGFTQKQDNSLEAK